MANNTGSNPVKIDTFSSDVVIFTGPGRVNFITLNSAAAGDLAVFIDKAGNTVLEIRNNVTAGGKDWVPAKPQQFLNGLILDVSASTGLGSGDTVYVGLE